MNPKEFKKFLIPIVLVFIVVTVYNMIFHGMCMEKLYMQYSHFFRSQDEICKHKYYMWIANLIYSTAFVYIYSKGHEKKNPIEQGIIYGIWIALLIWIPDALVTLTIYPFPKAMVFKWLVGYSLQSVLAGITVASVYKK